MPTRPSPLSERSANATPRPFYLSMATPAQNEKRTAVPQRTFKSNPVVQTRDAATKRRRDMFFKRVQKGRDDKQWEARSELIQRLDYISEHKRWEAEKAREAPHMDDSMMEEELEELTSSMSAQREEEVDYILSLEEKELQELIASMEDAEDKESQHFGSDDEDYDQLFMEYASASQPQQQQPQQDRSTNFADEDAMDIS